MRVILTNRRFVLFWVGQTISRLGDGCFLIALSWLIMDMTDSAAAVGNAMLLMTLPAAILALFGGAILDRSDFRKLMVGTDVASALLMGGLWALNATQHLHLWHVYGFALAFGCVQAVFLPIYLSAMPHLVEQHELRAANSLFSTSQELSGIAGPVTAGLLIAWFGAGSAIAINTLSFLISAGCILLMPATQKTFHQDRTEPFWRSILATFRYVRQQPIIIRLLMLRCLGNVGLAPFEILLVVYVRQVLLGGPHLFGWLSAGLGLGTLVGCFFGLPLRGWTTGKLIVHANVTIGVLVVVFAALPSTALSLVIVPVIGYFLGTEQVLVDILFQRLTAPYMLGRVSSLRVLASQSLRSGAQGLSGWASVLFGVGPAMLVGGSLVALVGILVGSTSSMRSVD